MKILVVGGRGAGIVGKAAVKDLATQEDVSQIVIGDLNIKKAETFSTIKKVTVRYIDILDKQALIEMMGSFDVVGNYVYWGYLYQITQAAIEARVSVADLGGMYYGTLKQMQLCASAKEVGITVLSGCGSSPGISMPRERRGFT